MENINSECDIILKWIYYLSKHLSEQELTSHMSLRTKRGRFSENFPILNWKYFYRILYIFWHIKQLQELFYMIWTQFKIQLLQISLAIFIIRFRKHKREYTWKKERQEKSSSKGLTWLTLLMGFLLHHWCKCQFFCVKFYSSPLNILKSYYCVIKLCSDVRSLNVLI